jgi:hypothetical protein
MRPLSKGQMLLVEDGFPRELILSEEERRATRVSQVVTPPTLIETQAPRPFDPGAAERKRISVKRLLRRVASSKDRAAAAAGMRWCTRRSVWYNEEEGSMPTKKEMLTEYNELAVKLGRKTRKTFDDRTQAELFLNQIRSDNTQAPAAPAASVEPEERTVAKKKVKAKTNGVGREVGKPAKPVAELKMIRAGTTRAKILALMNGSKTSVQVADAIGIEKNYLMSHVYCIWRDSGIGYKVEDGKLTAVYPGQKTIEDVIEQRSK